MIIPIADKAVQLPAPVLRPFIAQYAGFRITGLPPGLHFGLPSTNVDLIISLARPIEVVRMPNSIQRPSMLTSLVSGLQDTPAVIRQDRYAFGLHVFIKPLGVRAILGVASREISSLVLNLSDIWGNRAESLVEALLGAHSWRERFSILDRAFVSRLDRFSPQPEICWAWERLAKSHGSVAVQQLADEIGYSRRYFSERFRETIGVPPKLAARVFRFKRACRLMADNRLGLAHVAIGCGYSDQAHLTHEWYALAGCSPKTWIARELPFLQDYELGGRDDESHDLESQQSESDDSPDSAKR
jgi:AraC-like DNA-binding protein